MELLAESAVRVTAVALAVAVILKILGIRAPRLLHRAWTAVAALMLVLPALLAWGPRIAVPVLSRPPAEAVVIAPGADAVAAPAVAPAPLAATAASAGPPVS